MENKKNLFQLTENNLKKVNSIILENTASKVDLIETISQYIINSGGKQIRPTLCVAIANSFNYKGSDHHIIAACIELIHTATLLHDDVVDESNTRRGKKTSQNIWGNKASILSGDFLFAVAFKIMTKIDDVSCIKKLAEATFKLAEGEVMQLKNTNNITLTEDEYFTIIKSKTAVLFRAATEIASIIANANKKQKKELKKFGENIGIIFQLTDDILDYVGDEKNTGKNIGDDFREGKITYPIIICVQNATKKEKKFWQRTISKNEQKDCDLKNAIGLIKKYNSIEKTRELITKYKDIAFENIKHSGLKGDYEIAFKNLLIDIVNRKK